MKVFAVRRGSDPFRLAQVALLLCCLLAAACTPNKDGCVLVDTFCGVNPIDASPAPLVAVAGRNPIVVLGDGRPAIVMSSARVDEDAGRPVQPFAQEVDLATGTPGAPRALAGPTGNNFIASGRPGVYDRSESLAVAPNGQAFALWLGNDAGSLNLYANVYTPDGGFGGRVALASGLAANTRARRIAVDDQGNALAVWVQDGVKARLYRNATGWQAEQAVPAPAGVTLGDAVIRNALGWVVWTDATGAVFASRLAAETWQPPQRLGASSEPDQPARIAWHAAAVADPIAIWAAADGLRSTRLLPDGTAEVEGGTVVAGTAGALRPQALMLANGDVFVSWGGGVVSRYAGGVWEAPVIGLGTRMAGDAAGNVVQVGGSGSRVRIVRYVAGAGWQAGAEEVGDDLLAGVDPDVAMDAEGRAIVVWEAADTRTAEPTDTRIVTRTIGLPIASFTATPNPVVAGIAVQFDGSTSRDPAGAIASYLWTFGDGSIASTAITTHAYAAPGTYTARLAVTDDDRFAATAERVITVTAAPPGAGANLLVNPDFDVAVEVGALPAAPGNWRGDVAQVVGPENDIAPRSGPRMLQFVATSNVSSTNTVSSQQWQIVDLAAFRAQIAAGRARADGSVWFNRVTGTATTDRRFDLRLLAFAGAPAELPARYAAGNWLAQQATTVTTGGYQWQQALASLVLPAETSYLLFEIYAYEDVQNEGDTAEFAGHYADDAELVIVSVP